MHAFAKIVYVSTAVRPLTPAELEALLHAARAHNAQAGITGCLFYRDGNFMQLIEGPAEAITQLYARIRRDPRHYAVTTLVREGSTLREFEEWSMAAREVDGPQWVSLHEAFGPAAVAPAAPPAAGAPEPGRSLLRGFWNTWVG